MTKSTTNSLSDLRGLPDFRTKNSKFALQNMAHQVPEDGTMLPLMEEFYTIQGEGFNTGKAAYFIRLGGCDVGCHWCDVKESWDAELHALTSADQIVDHASQHPAKAVVVPGGEPLIYNLDYL